MNQHGHTSRFGWRMAVPSNYFRNIRDENSRFEVMSIDKKVDGGEALQCQLPSVIIATPSDPSSRCRWSRVTIRHRSLVAEKMGSIVAAIKYKGSKWDFLGICPLGLGHVAAVFRKIVMHCSLIADSFDVGRFMVYEVSTSRLVRTFDIDLNAVSHVYNIYGINDPKPLVVVNHFETSDDDTRTSFVSTHYEIPSIDHDQAMDRVRPAINYESTNEYATSGQCTASISVKLGRRTNLLFLGKGQNFAPTDGDIMVTCNAKIGFRIETMPAWEASWMAMRHNSTEGERLLSIFESLDSLNPTSRGSGALQPLANRSTPAKHFVRLQSLTLRMEGGVALFDSKDGVLRRWTRVPSLKALAVEALFRAKPHLDRERLKKAVGFDIFEGMSNVKRKEDIRFDHCD